MRRRDAAALLIVLMLAGADALAAEHPALAKARALYNAGDYDGAIAAAETARVDPASVDAASLVLARAHLERFRLRSGDATDLSAARGALGMARMASLSARDQVDLLVGLGQALYLAGAFGAAAELFDAGLSRSAMLDYRDRSVLLDWWATAIDRQGQQLATDRRETLFQPVVVRMQEELRRDPGHAAANYWLALAIRGTGDHERAWHAAIAAWVRAPLRPESAAALRSDVDRFVTTALIPELARARPVREQEPALAELQTDWDTVKQDWK